MTELIFSSFKWRTVNYLNVQDVILERMGQSYPILEREDPTIIQNQNCLRFIIFPTVTAEEQTAIDTFISTGEGTNMLKTILSYMAMQGWIDMGEYMVDGWAD
jgi:hypothetical protein